MSDRKAELERKRKRLEEIKKAREEKKKAIGGGRSNMAVLRCSVIFLTWLLFSVVLNSPNGDSGLDKYPCKGDHTF